MPSRVCHLVRARSRPRRRDPGSFEPLPHDGRNGRCGLCSRCRVYEMPLQQPGGSHRRIPQPRGRGAARIPAPLWIRNTTANAVRTATLTVEAARGLVITVGLLCDGLGVWVSIEPKPISGATRPRQPSRSGSGFQRRFVACPSVAARSSTPDHEAGNPRADRHPRREARDHGCIVKRPRGNGHAEFG